MFDTTPDLIIETGSVSGGAALYLAWLVDMFNPSCRVVTVEPLNNNNSSWSSHWNQVGNNSREAVMFHQRVTVLTGYVCTCHRCHTLMHCTSVPLSLCNSATRSTCTPVRIISTDQTRGASIVVIIRHDARSPSICLYKHTVMMHHCALPVTVVLGPLTLTLATI